jgi:death-on-curing family protein
MIEVITSEVRDANTQNDSSWQFFRRDFAQRKFMDGNKRAAFLTMGLFLCINGYRLTASQSEATKAVLALAASEKSEEELAQWIRDYSRVAS